MNYTETAKSIRTNARKILETKKIEDILKNAGDLFYTGSYALDLMTWNDIDMQLVPKDGLCPIDILGDFLKYISKDPGFIEGKMIRFNGTYKPKMPRGVYLGIQLDSPEYGGRWKFDIWVLSKEDFKKNRDFIQEIQKKLDPCTRKLILELKHEIMAGDERMPQMGSHFLYQAVLLNGIRNKEDLCQFYISQGMDLSSKKGL